MNIDYEAIAKEVSGKHMFLVSSGQAKAIIEAYEAQKARPEWVPLDLATVKQGQEVRCTAATVAGRFVSKYLDGFVVAADHGYHLYSRAEDWIVRTPKPKTVRVRVMRRGNAEYVAMHANILPSPGFEVVGEGDIEVKA